MLINEIHYVTPVSFSPVTKINPNNILTKTFNNSHFCKKAYKASIKGLHCFKYHAKFFSATVYITFLKQILQQGSSLPQMYQQRTAVSNYPYFLKFLLSLTSSNTSGKRKLIRIFLIRLICNRFHHVNKPGPIFAEIACNGCVNSSNALEQK